MKKSPLRHHSTSKSDWCDQFIRWARSRNATRLLLAAFSLHAAWISVSAVFPAAFDEDYHLSLIKLYSHQWHPFFTSQPANADSYGAVWRDPSYLYHYLLSWPWRLINLLTDNFMTQILMLRAINILLAVLGLVVWRMFLQRAKVSSMLANFVILLIAFTPLTALLASQINYDNALFLLAGMACYTALGYLQSLSQHKRVDVKRLLLLACICLLGSLVKYAFLPIFAALGGWVLWKTWHFQRSQPAKFRHSVWHELQLIGKKTKLGLGVLLILSGGLFIQRYGVNMAKYHTPTPECDQVLGVERCHAYSPWERNYSSAQKKPTNFQPQPINYTYHWLRHMSENLVFSVSSPSAGFAIGDPLILMSGLVILLALPGVILVMVDWRRLAKKNEAVQLAYVVVAVYMLVLWLQNYGEYSHLGRAVAIQGRYLIPILPLAYFLLSEAYCELLQDKPSWRLILGGVVVACCVLSGGAMTFVLRSDDGWYWQNQLVINSNHRIQRTLRPLRIGSDIWP